MPQGADSLLIQAAVSPTDQARRAWRDWIARRSLDEASWAEVRLLPGIAARARELDIAAEQVPRLDGIRRFVWSKTQQQMMAARPAMMAFANHGLTPMLLKGAAVISSGVATMAQRYVRDIDILVPAEKLGDAIPLLNDTGWHSPFFPTLEEALYLGFAKSHAIQFNGPNGGELDLHSYALAPNPFPGDDAGLWRRAVDGAYLNVRCKFPGREDLLINALEHSFRRDPDRVLDWSVDAARLIEAGGIDWRLVADCALERSLAVPVEGRLRYLREECGLASIPAAVLESLQPMCAERVFVDECLSNQFEGLKLPGARNRVRLRAATRRAARHPPMPSAPPPLANPGDAPTLTRRAGGKRIDIHLGGGAVDKVRLDISHGASFPRKWNLRVVCGAIQIRRLAGGAGLLPRFLRWFKCRFALNPVWFQAQGTDTLSLILDWKESAGETPGGKKAPLDLDCRAEVDSGRRLLIRLRLG